MSSCAGLPLLIQLYFIYYGLPQIPVVGFKLDSMTAAVLGVGLNYAAYAAEIYRAGLMAIPRPQTEAGLALGLSRSQTVRLVVLPQALRLVIPPVTNDFVALFKDTSIVSMLAIAELTHTFRAASIATGRYFEFAVITALIYFAISYPISRLARHMEKRIHPHHDYDTQTSLNALTGIRCSTTSASTYIGAKPWCSSVRPAAARRLCCGVSMALNSRTKG